jgi:uncharacterized protein YndB with AHSA1/START domain
MPKSEYMFIGDLNLMDEKFIAKASILINAPPTKVWEALITPQLIKRYLFGTEVTTDWQVGSPITYKGSWEGKAYEDKGKVLQIEPNKLLVSTFWSSMAGLADIPENYKTIRYDLFTEGGEETMLTITQDNNDTQDEANNSEQNWKAVLAEIKKLLES